MWFIFIGKLLAHYWKIYCQGTFNDCQSNIIKKLLKIYFCRVVSNKLLTKIVPSNPRFFVFSKNLQAALLCQSTIFNWRKFKQFLIKFWSEKWHVCSASHFSYSLNRRQRLAFEYWTSPVIRTLPFDNVGLWTF